MTSPYLPPNSEITVDDQPWKRPRFLTFWLYFMMIINLGVGLMYFGNPQGILQAVPKMSIGIIYSLGVGCLLNVIFAVAILKYKKWGFWGYCGVGACAFAINLTTLGLVTALQGLIGLLILAGLLYGNGKNNTWQRLK